MLGCAPSCVCRVPPAGCVPRRSVVPLSFARHPSRYFSRSCNLVPVRREFQTPQANFDAAPEWTLDQIAGLAFAALLIAAYYSSKIVDDYVAAGQRKDLGLCTMCGGVYDATDCPKEKCPCKAVPPPAP